MDSAFVRMLKGALFQLDQSKGHPWCDKRAKGWPCPIRKMEKLYSYRPTLEQLQLSMMTFATTVASHN